LADANDGRLPYAFLMLPGRNLLPGQESERFNDGLGNVLDIRSNQMWDITCITASVLFFIIAIAYTAGCDRLGMKEGRP